MRVSLCVSTQYLRILSTTFTRYCCLNVKIDIFFLKGISKLILINAKIFFNNLKQIVEMVMKHVK